jgi:hypothetical protein
LKLKEIFFWACDYNASSGEGRLGRLFIKEYKKKFKVNIKRIKPFKKKFLNYKYLSPFLGVVIAWLYFLKKKKFIYLNYLPYWNFLIFLLLPPNCKIGPITGGANFSKKSKDYLIRKNVFPILYCLSNIILKFRFDNLIFSTDLLKENLPIKIIKKSKFNFIFYSIGNKKITKKNNFKSKDLNFLFYFRKHNNKAFEFPFALINKLISKNYSINIIGDKINIKGVKNYGYISHKKVLKLLERTRYSIVSNENIFSFFTIDCINNRVKLLTNNKVYNSIKYFKNNFVRFNFDTNNLKILKLKKCQ